MTKRIVSLVLVFVMLFAICMTTVSCAQLEEFIGEENLGDEYLNKYYPDRNNGGDDNDIVKIPNEHASYAVKKEGYNLITFYWNNPMTDMSKCDLWAWWDNGGSAVVLWEKCEYGGRVTLSVPDDITEVGFIPRKECTTPGDDSSWGYALKDCGDDDLFATIEGEDTFIYLRGGRKDANQYHSYDGGETLEVIEKFNLAGIIDRNTIEYYITPATKLTRASQVRVMDGDKEIAVTKVTNLNKASNSGKITVDAELDITKEYTLYIDGFGSKTVVATEIFDTEWFAENYHYDGNDLGATINNNGTVTFKVWAPTASKVVLNLYKTGAKDEFSEEDKSFDMTCGANDKGVWSFTTEAGHGTYYTYSVTTAVGTQEAVDPYARAAGVNGDRGMVVDLSKTNPDGWDADRKFNTGIDSYSDAIIWEIHIRDFSNKIKDSEYKGKYLAFTEKGLVNEHGVPVGIDYLKALGVNYVHLLPSYDYATVDEDYLGEDWKEMFNWGYDPKNYNVPEGSYSTDPYNGEVRIREYKEMVMALHEAGIGVIMDVVYNHTYDKNASFNKIVPYYYYRYKPNGANSSGSGCGNDTASERFMYGKFMVESVSYWMNEYNLDGFRFDLMGLHDMETMQKLESAVHTIDPQAILYGEGWEMMVNQYQGAESANAANIKNITATNNAIGTIAVFNDTTRVGLKGEADKANDNGYINGNVNNFYRNKVLFGINGGTGASAQSWWSVKNAMVVNYLSAHDNSTLWDKLTFSNKSASLEQKLAMNRLGATILYVSKGIVFYQAGEEFLRSKPNSKDPNGYDRNSYRSNDEVNNLRWDTLKPGSAEHNMFLYYAGLSAIRTKFDIFTNNTKFQASSHGSSNMGISIIIESADGGKAVVIINPENRNIDFDLGIVSNESFYLVCNGTQAGITSLGTCSGKISVPACSAYILVNGQVLNNPKK